MGQLNGDFWINPKILPNANNFARYKCKKRVHIKAIFTNTDTNINC